MSLETYSNWVVNSCTNLTGAARKLMLGSFSHKAYDEQAQISVELAMLTADHLVDRKIITESQALYLVETISHVFDHVAGKIYDAFYVTTPFVDRTNDFKGTCFVQDFKLHILEGRIACCGGHSKFVDLVNATEIDKLDRAPVEEFVVNMTALYLQRGREPIGREVRIRANLPGLPKENVKCQPPSAAESS